MKLLILLLVLLAQLVHCYYNTQTVRNVEVHASKGKLGDFKKLCNNN